ncbi:hypothetical protein MRB53_039901 [Persea americana]|nr:hypothetical protein MRB53_039901 [Persea americana]
MWSINLARVIHDCFVRWSGTRSFRVTALSEAYGGLGGVRGPRSKRLVVASIIGMAVASSDAGIKPSSKTINELAKFSSMFGATASSS